MIRTTSGVGRVWSAFANAVARFSAVVEILGESAGGRVAERRGERVVCEEDGRASLEGGVR